MFRSLRDLENKFIKLLCLAIILTLFITSKSIAQTCCQRNVGSEILFPYPKDSKVYNDMGCMGADCGWDEVFVSFEYGGGPKLKCPKIDIIELDPVKPLPIPPKLDYKFSGRYTVTGDGSPPRGYTVTLQVDLIDLAHGKTVKSAKSTWTCVPKEAGYCLKVRSQESIKLSKTFMPLDKLIYDYERIPETVKIELEKDPILAGEKMKITLRNIVDANSKPSQPWQRILVKAEKGKILNGEPLKDFKVFRVGNGIVEIEYQAPDICKNDVETLIVMNSCHIKPDLPAIPEREIAKKKFNIFCVEGKIIISCRPFYDVYLFALNWENDCGYTGEVVYEHPSKINFRLKPSKDPCYYEVVQKEPTPLKYKYVFTPADMESCAKMTQTYEGNFRLKNAVVNFRKNSQRPFSFEIDNKFKASTLVETLSAPPIVIPNESDWSAGLGGKWPLIDGYRTPVPEVFESYIIVGGEGVGGIGGYMELKIDNKEVQRLKERCFKKK